MSFRCSAGEQRNQVDKSDIISDLSFRRWKIRDEKGLIAWLTAIITISRPRWNIHLLFDNSSATKVDRTLSRVLLLVFSHSCFGLLGNHLTYSSQYEVARVRANKELGLSVILIFIVTFKVSRIGPDDDL